MLKNLKLYAYEKLVNYNLNVKKLYEDYVNNNYAFHKKNPSKSFRYLIKLRRYYNRGAIGNLPIAPSYEKSINLNKKIEESDYTLIRESLYFDRAWYLKTYKDVKGDPVEHYLIKGWREFRRPGPSFSTLLYLNRYADVSESGMNPLVHYEKIGKYEKRASSYNSLYNSVKREIEIIENSKYFDSNWYTKKYLKKNLSCEKASVHYYCIGCYLGYDPSTAFSSILYKKDFPDVENFPYLLHYETYSKSHGKGYFNLSTNYYSNKDLYSKSLNSLVETLFDMQEYKSKKKVLLISHTLNLTGAPRVLFEMSLVLKEQGFYPVIMTINEGPLIKEIEKAGISVVISNNYENPELFVNISRFAQQFDFMVFSTVEALKFAHLFKYNKAYKIAWVHEGNETLKLISDKQKKRINLMDEIYTGSSYCNKFFEPYIVDKNKLDVLYYGIDDSNIKNIVAIDQGGRNKTIIVIAGTIGYRKGHHILAEAIRRMQKSSLHKMEIWIVGFVIDEEVGKDIYELASEYSEIVLFGQVDNEKLLEIIKTADVLLCPSIDDPLPVVVTNALMLKTPVIVSNMVGTSSFIKNGENGFVIESNSAGSLENILEKIVNEDTNLEEIGKRGNEIYLKYLSYKVFTERISQIFDINKIKESEKYRTLTNEVQFVDLQIRNNGYIFTFICDSDNELCIVYENDIYKEEVLNEKKWNCLNSYLEKDNKRVASIIVNSRCLLGSRVMVASEKMDTINLKIGEYSWLSFNKLAQNDFCVWINENVLSFITKAEYYNRVINNPGISKDIKQIVCEANSIKEYTYNVYCETRNNMNDNAYMLFLYDLKLNSNAYFLTTKENFEKEQDEIIKDHLLILNSPEAKKIMMHAKMIVSSWYAPPIYGYTKMLLIYPFLHLNYIFVPHGISYDKDSYYLNRVLWGEFTKTICSSELEKEYFIESNGYKNVKVLGYPRMDKWFEGRTDEKMVLIFPSWRDEIDVHYIDTIIEICQRILSDIPDMQVVYLAHPSIEKQDYNIISSHLKQISKKIVIGSCEENEVFNDYFSRAKYLITDYSSVAYDFAYKSGISIYYEPFIDDRIHYHVNELFDQYNCGISCKDIRELIDILNGKFEVELLQYRTKNFFKYIDNCNTERVFKEISKVD